MKLIPGIREVIVQEDVVVIHLEKETETPSIIAKLVYAGIEIEEVRRAATSLEEAFLSYIEDKRDA